MGAEQAFGATTSISCLPLRQTHLRHYSCSDGTELRGTDRGFRLVVIFLLVKLLLSIHDPRAETTKMPNQTQDLHTVDDKSFDYIFEQNATVPLRSSEGLVRVNVYRPKTQEKVPVLVTYGPYGKDIPYSE